MPPTVTVAIPVLNGARYLDEVLTAVRAQRDVPEVEILIVDSGSTDGSLEIARRHGAVIHEIDKRDFSHGGTRNRMVELASGDHVAFLTQDATPASDRWLASLLEGFEQADDVGAVFGPHDARPDASHMIKSEMERHFASWGEGGVEIDVQRLDRSAEGLAAYRAFPGQLTFFSDVNGAVARSAWEQVPYREVPYAEDQLIGRELIEAGYAKVYHPGARVQHSHDYPPLAFLRRYFDEFRSLREVLGFVQPWGPKRTLWDVRGLVGADKRWLREQGVHGAELVKLLLISGRHHTIRMAGAILGTRADRMPPAIRKALSLEGRSTYVPHEVPASVLEGSTAVIDEKWPWEFVRRTYPRREPALEPFAPRSGMPMTVAWIVPVWNVGSGGHTTIFRLIRQLELRGHRCVIHLHDPNLFEPRAGGVLREEIRERFVPVEAQVFRDLSTWTGADVAIATEWRTAFPLRDLPGCKVKAYLVQDDETQFYATSSQSIWADESYKLGYKCIAYTPWMADVLRERDGVDARYFECGTDTDVYTFAGEEGRDPNLIVLYARGETQRRAVELALAGLATVFERRPNLRVVVFGSNEEVGSPIPVEDVGVQPPARLAELYRQASVGLVFSLTTHSLVAHEMMASGLPLVELEGENVSSALGPSGDLVELAEPTPDAIADRIERLLDDREHAAAMAVRARAFVEERTWERAGDQVEGALFEFLAGDR